jgi:anthranilate phosphoribosyltransferase
VPTSVKVKRANPNERIYDIVGTGGDGAHTFNISTAAAFVLAGTGRKVAKHGNRAASSQCGSADVLSALGVSLDLTPDQIAARHRQHRHRFYVRAKFHPAMKHAIGPRKEIGQRTIFNVLGPLTNPAGANIQLTGVYAAKLTEPLANVLKELGSRAALIIYGATAPTNSTPRASIASVISKMAPSTPMTLIPPNSVSPPHDGRSARRHAR